MSTTIIDVAKKCGYSKATVSRAFISPETVTEKTRNIIYAAAKELNYAPNTIARALVRQATENIAFIIHEKQYPTMLNPFYAPVLEAIMLEATKNNYSLFIDTSHDAKLPNGESYIRKRMDGVIFAGQTEKEAIKVFQQQNIPVVLLNNELDMEGLFCVSTEHYEGAMLAVEYLYNKGHRKIGLLAGRFSKQVSEARLKGYLSVLRKHNLEVDDRFIADVEPTIEDAENKFTELLKLENRPTAFFCTNDAIAAGAVKATIHAGLRIPQDMAIVGFDDSIISKMCEPELTTIHIDTFSMGKLAANILFDLMNKKTPSEKCVKIQPQLVIRGTT